MPNNINNGDIMESIIEKIKKDTSSIPDMVIRDISINNKKIYIVFNDSLCDVEYINRFILDRITLINNTQNLYEEIYNRLPIGNVKEIYSYDEVIKNIFQGFTIIIVNEKYLIVETRASLDRGINETNSEVSLVGPKDALTESYSKNLGLIRKRLRTKDLMVDEFNLGTLSNTKVGLLYISSITDDNLIKKVKEKLDSINIDGILDTGYIREIILDNESIFPTVNITERPDNISQALLEGKIAIIVDNTPYAMIIPTFFIDFFHTPDDYYQKSFNIRFIRIIRFLAFIISIFLPAYYISITTHNPESVPINLLTNFASQRLKVPFPGFIEALVMIICFEILRESDARIPSKVGTSVSILGGLVIGEAAVNAGILSPIMIIVIAISMVSGLLFTSNYLIYSIRYFRIIILILSAFFGLFGLFIGMMLLITKLCSINSFGYPYMAPLAPIIKSEFRDSIFKFRGKKVRLRNPLLAKKNIIRGKSIWKR